MSEPTVENARLTVAEREGLHADMAAWAKVMPYNHLGLDYGLSDGIWTRLDAAVERILAGRLEAAWEEGHEVCEWPGCLRGHQNPYGIATPPGERRRGMAPTVGVEDHSPPADVPAATVRARAIRSVSTPPGLHACEGCGVELDGDDPSTRCDECPIPPGQP